MTMPAHTARLHLKPYWLGDSPAAIKKAGRRRAGRGRGRYIDLNLSRVADGEVGMHWGTAGQNGFFFTTTGRRGQRRPLTRVEIHRPLGSWRLADIKRLRRTRRIGVSYRSRVRPFSYRELTRLCKRHGVTPCFELKSRTFADQETAERMVDIAAAEKAVVFFMTLVTMKNWQGKVKTFHDAGAEIALLAHGAKRPADYPQYEKYVTRLWGHFR